jgi:predicted HTH transcriptional regulator
MVETNRIEYKQQLTDDLEKEVVAFLNYHEGGLLYIGVDKYGHAIGAPDVDTLQLKIKDRLKNNILPSCMGLFDIILEEQNSKQIIKIIVASGPEKPYHLRKYGMSEKGVFIRTGSAAEPMPGKMIEKLFARRTRNSLGRIEANRQDLRFEQLKIYYEESGRKLNNQFATNLGLRTKENTLSIKVAKYNGLNRVDLIENNEYGYCSLIKATKLVVDKIELENKTSSRITSQKRIDSRLWNPIALREAIINALLCKCLHKRAYVNGNIM